MTALVWEDLLAVLRKENELLRLLISLNEEKQRQINQVEEVVRLAGEEQVILSRLEKADQERAVLYDTVAGGRELDQWFLTLDQDQQSEVEPLVLELTENIAALQSLNDLNQELLLQSLNYVQFSLNLLMGDESPATYAPAGRRMSRRAIFDRKV